MTDNHTIGKDHTRMESVRALLAECGINTPVEVTPFEPIVLIHTDFGWIDCLTQDRYRARLVSQFFQIFLDLHTDRCVGFRITDPAAAISRIIELIKECGLANDTVTLEHIVRVTRTISWEHGQLIPMRMIELACEIARTHNFVLTREQYEPFLITPTN